MVHEEGTSSSLVKCKIHILHIIIHKRVLENNTSARAHSKACVRTHVCVCVWEAVRAVCQCSVYHLGRARLCDRSAGPIVLIPRAHNTYISITLRFGEAKGVRDSDSTSEGFTIGAPVLISKPVPESCVQTTRVLYFPPLPCALGIPRKTCLQNSFV